MKQNTIFSYVHKTCAVIAGAALLFLAACSVQTGEETTAGGDMVSVRIAVGEETRTALPTLARDDFIAFTLTCDDTPAGSWQATDTLTAYQAMNASRVQLESGIHTFVLTATETGGATYKGTLTQAVSDGTVLTFTLSLASIPATGSGSVRISVNYASAASSVSTVGIKRYESADEAGYAEAPVAHSTTAASPADGVYLYTEDEIPSGQYILEFTFYDANGLIRGIWPELISILPGRESTAAKTLPSLSRTYTITYTLNGGSVAGSASTTAYSGQYTIFAPVTLQEVTRRGYDFAGWYESEDFDGTAIEGWEKRTRAGAVTVYAKWTPHVYSITYKDADGSAFSGTHETGFATTHTYTQETALDAPTPADSEYAFGGWYIGRESESGSVTLNGTRLTVLSETGYYEDITLYAKWLRSTYYVSETGNDTDGTGSEEAPYQTLSKTVNVIKGLSNPVPYTVIVSGTVTGTTTVTFAATQATAFTLRGATATGNALNGGASGPLLVFDTAVPVTISNLTLTNGKATAQNRAGGLTLLNSHGDVTLAGGTIITDNHSLNFIAQTAGGVFVSTGTLTIEDGVEITENSSADLCGGLYVYGTDAHVIMNGGSISNNTSGGDAAGVNMANGLFTMNGGSISNNVATGKAGGVRLMGSSRFEMLGGSISQNRATSGAGVNVWSSDSQFMMTDGTISGNTATATGGISGSSTTYEGGGIFNRGTCILQGGTISANSATEYGGAVYSSGTLKLSGSIYIPAGTGNANNVYLASGKMVTIAGDLAAAEGDTTWTTPVATLTPNSFEANRMLLGAGTSGDITITQSMADMFALTASSDGTPWTITVSGTNAYLCRPVYTITPKDKDDAAFTGTLSEPFTHQYGSVTTLEEPVREGYTFQGWHKQADCADTVVTQILTDEYTAPFTLYARWSRASVVFTINNDGISLTKAESPDGTVTITAADGYTGYTWKIRGEEPATAITGAAVSNGGKTLTFNTANMVFETSYVISVTAQNSNGIKEHASLAVKKQEAEE